LQEVFMIGDLIMRYQYLSLVYFLRRDKWFDPNATANHLVNEKSFSSWDELYTSTNSMLAPMEICDCYRDKSKFSVSKADTVENRYYHDRERDNMVVYLQSYGDGIPMHGRWNSSTVLRKLAAQSSPEIRSSPDNAGFAKPNNDFVWSFGKAQWHHAIDDYVRDFAPKHVVFNAGWWKNTFQNPGVNLNFTQSLQKNDIKGIWRSTTFDQAHGLGRRSRFIRAFERQIWNQLCNSSTGSANASTLCMDVGWTEKVTSNMYWNELHFFEPVYRVMNEELLELLGYSFPSNYTKQAKELLFGDG
jgi:hypothetical protein